MLTLTIGGKEFFNEETMEFIYGKETTIVLEHSLISLSKWESIWHKPFLIDNVELSREEIISYVKCMTVSQNVNDTVYEGLSPENLTEIRNYISDPMTATTFNEIGGRTGGRREILTNEVIYSQMVALQIPFECQKWHLNRLLTLIKVCNLRNQPPKKMSKSEILRNNSALNAERKARLGTRG